MSDYLAVEYSDGKRPFTDYPSKLANYIINTFNLVPGQSVLEIGCGRCELLSHFTNFGYDTYGIDNAESAANFAESANAKFELIEYKQQMTKPIFDGKKLISFLQKILLNTLQTHYPSSNGVMNC